MVHMYDEHGGLESLSRCAGRQGTVSVASVQCSHRSLDVYSQTLTGLCYVSSGVYVDKALSVLHLCTDPEVTNEITHDDNTM